MTKNIVLSSTVLLGLLTGCATPSLQVPNLSKSKQLDQNATFLEKQLFYADSLEGVLKEYELANAYRHEADYNKSIHHFTLSEMYLKESDTQNVFSSGVENIGAIVVNDTIMDYEPKHYERVMVNTYKAINSMLRGEDDDARIEFNRAMERQRKAREYFANEIKEKKEELNKKAELEQKKYSTKNTKQALTPKGTIYDQVNDPEIEQIVLKAYPSIASLKPYPDFVNPFATYMSALFAIKDKEYAKAVDYLKIVAGIMRKNKTVAGDLFLADKAMGSLKGLKKKYTWVVIEDGQSFHKKEFKLDLPLFLFSNKIQYIGVALPQLDETKTFSNIPIVEGKNSEIVADMNTVIKSEFKKRLPMVYTRAFLSTAAKTWLQYESKNQFGLAGGIISGLYAAATNKADVRMWSTLPSKFYTLRLNNSSMKDSVININNLSIGNKSIGVDIDKSKNAIIFVSAVYNNETPKVELVQF